MLDYLKRRGVSDGVIRKFGLGAAPNSWDALTRAMQAKGYTTEELQMAGLIVIKDAEERQRIALRARAAPLTCSATARFSPSSTNTATSWRLAARN